MYYVYVLKRNKQKYYVGFTRDLKRRFAEHSKQYACELVYYEAYKTSKLARDREENLKSYGSAWQGLKRRIETHKKAG
jgi:putative endonuclease